MKKRVGVLALQGAVFEHLDMAGRAGAIGVPVTSRKNLSSVDALVIPGGESTAISRLIRQNELEEAIREFAAACPVLGTCAGLVLCGKEVAGSMGEPRPLGLMDISVERNGFGRQIDSFEIGLTVEELGTIPAVFIRAPFIRSAGAGVRLMAFVDGKAVMAEQKNVLVTAFHPELTENLAIYSYFIKKIRAC